MRKLCLRGKRGQGKHTLVDDEDFKELQEHRWYLTADGYVHGRAGRLSRFLMQPGVDRVVDHKNGNPLDNRRQNLRVCTIEQNNQNNRKVGTHGYRGICRAGDGYYRAVCKKRDLGRFPSKEAAAVAYNKAALELYGEFAFLNEVGQ